MASLPDTLRLYAIGDIHGRVDLLADMLEQITREELKRGPAASHLIFLGDYIDRGPDSFGVVETLLHGLPEGLEADFLMGNHERMLLDALADPAELAQWALNGGMEAIDSYLRAARLAGNPRTDIADLADMIPESHRQFYEDLRPSVQYGDYFFVHAGVRPGVALDQQDPRDLLWIRDKFLKFKGNFGKVIVHGHTPGEEPVVRDNRIGIDTAAVFTGRLTALVLEGDRRDFLHT